MYVIFDRVIMNHDYFMLMFICTYVYMYDDDLRDHYYFMVYVCVHVSMLLLGNVVRDHSCGGMIAYIGEWHDEFLEMRNQVGRVVMTNI